MILFHGGLAPGPVAQADMKRAVGASKSDAVEHFKHLEEISNPEVFDHEDDSVFNDQDDRPAQEL
jgi:hypothetical protein